MMVILQKKFHRLLFLYLYKKVHQYDAQCIMTGGLFSCHQEVKQAHRPEG